MTRTARTKKLRLQWDVSAAQPTTSTSVILANATPTPGWPPVQFFLGRRSEVGHDSAAGHATQAIWVTFFGPRTRPAFAAAPGAKGSATSFVEALATRRFGRVCTANHLVAV